VRNDVPRTSFAQDLLYSLGSLLTVCRIERNNAEERVRAMILGDSDPGLSPKAQAEVVAAEGDVEPEVVADVEQMARDQIMSHIRQNFKDHDLARLVAAVLNAEGYTTKVSPPGPDGGVDILAGQGPLGFDGTHLCVQVKATQSSVDVRVFRELQGTMTNFNAAQGLLVSWGGFTRPAEEEARKSFFTVRLWDADALVNAVLEIYDKLPEEFRSELPLKRVWTLVVDEQAV
ncbi:MAG: restriction endonuclease, partial [Dehalococcoidia bacterium]